ncbi:hypothetical protein [Pseudomonas fluorescens]|nr:hypothetical protein [Pseudomonas fluorescens]
MKKSCLWFALTLFVAVAAAPALAGPAKASVITPNTRVNTTIAGVRGFPSLAALGDGGYLVTWENALDDSYSDVYQQRYAASGTKMGVEAQVNAHAPGPQGLSAVTTLGDGGWLVTWQRDLEVGSDSGAYQQDDWDSDVYQQRYAASGAKVDVESQVNTTENGDQTSPTATALVDGGWLVTWRSDPQDGSDWGIYQQRYAASGAKVGGEIQHSTTENSDKDLPAVTALTDGGWLVTWQSERQEGEGLSVDIYQQRYAVSGAKEGIETRVNTTTSGNQSGCGVTALADGGWLVKWKSDLPDRSDRGIYQQRYALSGGQDGRRDAGQYRHKLQNHHARRFIHHGSYLSGGWRLGSNME